MSKGVEPHSFRGILQLAVFVLRQADGPARSTDDDLNGPLGSASYGCNTLGERWEEVRAGAGRDI